MCSTVDLMFCTFEIGDALRHQPTDGIVTLEYGYVVSNSIQLLCCSESARSAAHHRHLVPGASSRWLRNNPSS